jgi:hypothetical protein
VALVAYSINAAGPRARSKRRTFIVTFALTCLTIVSARDLSNCGQCVSHCNPATHRKTLYLLKNFHGQLWGYGSACDELVQRVGQGHSDANSRDQRLDRGERVQNIRGAAIELVVRRGHGGVQRARWWWQEEKEAESDTDVGPRSGDLRVAGRVERFGPKDDCILFAMRPKICLL